MLVVVLDAECGDTALTAEATEIVGGISTRRTLHPVLQTLLTRNRTESGQCQA